MLIVGVFMIAWERAARLRLLTATSSRWVIGEGDIVPLMNLQFSHLVFLFYYASPPRIDSMLGNTFHPVTEKVVDLIKAPHAL